MSEDGRYFGASIEHSEDGAEYYMAREVSTFLGYTKWTAFLTVLYRAMRVFQDASVHFQPIERLTPTPKTVVRTVDDYRLSRRAFLFIVINADVYLPMVAKGKGYIAQSVIAAQEQEVQTPSFLDFARELGMPDPYLRQLEQELQKGGDL